jgi:CheY-like chemotaxis protein
MHAQRACSRAPEGLAQRAAASIIAQAGIVGRRGNSAPHLHFIQRAGGPFKKTASTLSVLADNNAHEQIQNGTGSMYNESLNYFAPRLPDRESGSESTSKTILLVDDDPDIRSLTRTFLKHEGYHVHSCGDAERAGQIFRGLLEQSAGIDLLITDFYMPDRTGMDLALELKSFRHDLPVLLISGGFMAIEQLDQLRASNWNFLSKPFAFTDLLAAVHLILGNSEATL